jgi:hypothetical protein
MFSPADLPEMLRTLGQFLDASVADDAQLDCEERYWKVRWQAADGTWRNRTFTRTDLRTHSDVARRDRRPMAGAPGGEPLNEWSVCLRALGQDLAAQQVELTSLRVESDGFRVRGVQQGRYCSEWFGLEDLLERNQTRQTDRVLQAVRSGPLDVVGGWLARFGRRPTP